MHVSRIIRNQSIDCEHVVLLLKVQRRLQNLFLRFNFKPFFIKRKLNLQLITVSYQQISNFDKNINNYNHMQFDEDFSSLLLSIFLFQEIQYLFHYFIKFLFLVTKVNQFSNHVTKPCGGCHVIPSLYTASSSFLIFLLLFFKKN